MGWVDGFVYWGIKLGDMEKKKIYIVTEQLDYGLYDMSNARAFENELDATLAAELGGLDIVVLDVIEPQKYGSQINRTPRS
jgi:hypothetical protein